VGRDAAFKQHLIDYCNQAGREVVEFAILAVEFYMTEVAYMRCGLGLFLGKWKEMQRSYISQHMEFGWISSTVKGNGTFGLWTPSLGSQSIIYLLLLKRILQVQRNVRFHF
jgi:hypothetical protein